MSHALSSVSLKDVPAIISGPKFAPPARAIATLWGLLLLGVVVFVLGVSGSEAKRAWMAFHVNFTYWFLLAAASTCFSAVLHLSNAQWARPIRRVFDASSAFFVYSLVPFIFLYFGHHHLFVWAHEQIPGKGNWLTSNFVFLRDFCAILVLLFLARRVVFYALRRDLGVIRSGATGVAESVLEPWKEKHLDSFVRAWGDNVKKEVDEATTQMWRLSPLVIVSYAVVMTLIAFDQIMSVDPHWYSTLFGAFYFMSGVYLAMAWAAIIVVLSREIHPIFRAKVERRTLHDLGKLLFGFGIFWAYLFWSHYLTIWYGNMPEETGWVILRLRQEPWHGFAWLILGCCFIVPFLLGLSRDLKQVPILLFATAIFVACGLLFQQYLLFAPTLYPHEIPFGWADVFISLGFMAAYLLSVFSFLAKHPLIPFGDFYGELPLEHK